MSSSVKLRKLVFIALISLVVGFIHIYPDLKFIYELGSDFKGITFNAAHDSAIYLGRINSIYKGDYKTIASIDLYEHRHDPWRMPFLGELILGTIGSSLGIPLSYFKIILSFSLPIINFWLIYYIAFFLGNSKSAAIISAFAATLGYSFFTGNPIYMYELLFKKEAGIQLWFLRPISPQFNYILLFFSWISIYFFLVKKTYKYAVLSGLSIGVFFYIGGIYYLTYFFAFIGLYTLLTIIRKDYPQFKKTAIILILIIILAIPFLINYFKLISLSEYKYLVERLAIIYGRNPIIPIGITIISILLIWFHYSRKTEQSVFIILFVLSGFICLNQQLITGKTSQPSHWQNYMVKTFTIIALFPTIVLFLKENNYLYSKGYFLKNVVIVTFIILAILQQENYYQRFKNRFVEMQKLAGPFNWLKENTKREDVVLNDPMNFITGNIPYQQDFLMYAKNYVYLPSVMDTLVSEDEVEHRYLSALRFFNYNLNEAESFFTYWNGIAFRGMVAEISFGGSKIPDDYLFRLKNKYIEFLKEEPTELLSRYKVDYIILQKLNPLYDKIDGIYKITPKVYDDGHFKIYKISVNNFVKS